MFCGISSLYRSHNGATILHHLAKSAENCNIFVIFFKHNDIQKTMSTPKKQRHISSHMMKYVIINIFDK